MLIGEDAQFAVFTGWAARWTVRFSAPARGLSVTA